MVIREGEPEQRDGSCSRIAHTKRLHKTQHPAPEQSGSTSAHGSGLVNQSALTNRRFLKVNLGGLQDVYCTTIPSCQGDPLRAPVGSPRQWRDVPSNSLRPQKDTQGHRASCTPREPYRRFIPLAAASPIREMLLSPIPHQSRAAIAPPGNPSRRPWGRASPPAPNPAKTSGRLTANQQGAPGLPIPP